jgi:hypothetical protein
MYRIMRRPLQILRWRVASKNVVPIWMLPYNDRITCEKLADLR